MSKIGVTVMTAWYKVTPKNVTYKNANNFCMFSTNYFILFTYAGTNKTTIESFESETELTSLSYDTRGRYAPDVYVRASTLRCFHSLSAQTCRKLYGRAAW